MLFISQEISYVLKNNNFMIFVELIKDCSINYHSYKQKDRQISALLQITIKMSTRVSIDISFYFENQHYSQLHANIPRLEAVSIPELKMQTKNKVQVWAVQPKASLQLNSITSRSKKDSQNDNSELDDSDNNIPKQMQIDNDIQNEQQSQIDQQQQKQMQKALQMLQKQQQDYSEELEENNDSDKIDDEQQELENVDSFSSQPIKYNIKIKTQRQKKENRNFIQLPDRRPRKNKNLDQANELLKRQEKEKKRKQYLQKQIEAQEKVTLDKILNESGRKLRIREQKQIQQVLEREQKVFRTLGNVPKIITLISQVGKTIILNNTQLFSDEMTTSPDIKMKQICTNCGIQSKYKLKNMEKYACSLACYKILKI